MKAKQGLLAVLVVLIGGAAAVGAAAAYYWQRATAVPSWYTSATTDRALAANLSSGSRVLQDKLYSGEGVQYLSDRQVEIMLDEAEFNQLIQEGLSQNPETASLLSATQGVKATLEGDQLQAGVVINPAELPIQDLPINVQATLQQTLDSLPMLENQALYIGITGNPRVENGQLILSDDTRLQVGNVQLSTAEVARMTGLSPDQLARQLNGVLPQLGVTLENLEFVDGQAILRGTPE